MCTGPIISFFLMLFFALFSKHDFTTPCTISCTYVNSSIGETRNDNVQERAKELRVALCRAYERVSAAGGLNSFHGPEVTEDVLPYIPLGTSFTEAVALLSYAGFTIGRYPDINAPPDRNRSRDWYALTTSVSPFASQLIDRDDLYISLLPPSPGEYTTVSKLTAKFFRTSL